VEASFSLGRDVIGWRQLKTAGQTLRKNVIVRQFARPINGILASTDTELDTTNTENNSEMKKQVQERKLNRMAKVHDFLEMWQGSQNLRATQKESRSPHMQMTPMGYISDTDEIVKASWSLIQHHGAAGFKFVERSPLPLPLFARTSQEDELKCKISAETEQSTIIQSKVTRIAQLKAFRTLKIGLTGMENWIIRMTAKMIPRQTLNLEWCKTIEWSMRNP
jgi:hypothetical protein